MTANACEPNAVPGTVLGHTDITTRRSNKLGVSHGAARVDLEVISAALVIEWIENPHEPIIGCEKPIADHLISQQPCGVGIVKLRTDVKVFAIEDDPNFGALRRRFPVPRIGLFEVGCGLTRPQ